MTLVNNCALNSKVVLENLNVVIANLTLQEMKFGWQIIDGSIIGFFGATFRSASSVCGGGIFVTISKCKKQAYPCGRSSVKDL